MKRRSLLLIAATAGLLQTACSDSPRARRFAELPEWTGIWVIAEGAASEVGVSLSGRTPDGDVGYLSRTKLAGTHPPYNPEWEQRYQAALHDSHALDGFKQCEFYFPATQESPDPFSILVTPEETAFIWVDRAVRHIYTDGRPHSPKEERWPTPWGESVGEWHDGTLVVDTIGVKPGAFLPMLSEAARFTERISMVGPGRLLDVLTIEDPTALTRAWQITLHYQRADGLSRMMHGDCLESDR